MRQSTTTGMIVLLQAASPDSTVDARESVETRLPQWGPPASDYWQPSPQERARKRNERKAKRRARG